MVYVFDKNKQTFHSQALEQDREPSQLEDSRDQAVQLCEPSQVDSP